MKKISLYLVLSTALAVLLFSCASPAVENQSDTPSTNETEVSTTDDQTTADTTAPPVEKVTYTLPDYMVIGDTVQWKYTYADDGSSISRVDYTEDPPITYTLNFDSDGLPRSLSWTVEVNDERLEKWEDVYFIDANGNIETEKRYCEGELQHTYRYTYDSNSRILTQQSVKRKNGLESIYTLTYDEMGECVGITEKKKGLEETEYKERVENTYSEDGLLLKTVSPSLETNYEYQFKEGLVTTQKVSYSREDAHWSYYYQFAYENEKLTRKDSYFEERLTDTTYYTESEFEHYLKWAEWVFRDRLP